MSTHMEHVCLYLYVCTTTTTEGLKVLMSPLYSMHERYRQPHSVSP